MSISEGIAQAVVSSSSFASFSAHHRHLRHLPLPHPRALRLLHSHPWEEVYIGHIHGEYNVKNGPNLEHRAKRQKTMEFSLLEVQVQRVLLVEDTKETPLLLLGLFIEIHI